MGVRRHRELEAWQLAHGVRKAIIDLVSRDVVRRDYDFCKETKASARSACRNLAEGFGRYGHREFAHFVNIARGELLELLDATDEALEMRYVDRSEYDRLNNLIDAAIEKAGGLHTYLINTPTPPPKPRRRREE